MGFSSINTNVAAYYAQSNLKAAGSKAQSSISRLSSGNKIVQASDDVAALSVGTVLQTGVSTLKRALLNASQAQSVLQVADGGLANVTAILQRQKVLTVQAQSGSLSTTERSFLNQEFQQLTAEIDRLVENTKFNAVTLLNGSLGSARTDLAATDALAALLVGAGNTIGSTNAIEAINIDTGLSVVGNAALGELQFVDADGTTALVDEQFLSVNAAVYGKIGKFELSNVAYGLSATLTVQINGVTFTGNIADGDTNAVLRNGNTRIDFGIGTFTLTDASTTQVALADLNNSFTNVRIMRTAQVQGVNFAGTALEGVNFNVGGGTPMVRLNDLNNATISTFRYESNEGAADTNTLSVMVGGTKFFAVDVVDNIADGTVLTFTDGNQQVLEIDLSALAGTQFADNDITDIRTSSTDRANFINALNAGFANAGAGASFAVGTSSADSISVKIQDVSSSRLFEGKGLNILTEAAAVEASDALDRAISTVTAVRADVGAQQSRFNFASANLETTIQNQDAARGVLLDTDISEESTAFATQQVLLQAGISVLAQANLLPQQLLKLIG